MFYRAVYISLYVYRAVHISLNVYRAIYSSPNVYFAIYSSPNVYLATYNSPRDESMLLKYRPLPDHLIQDDSLAIIPLLNIVMSISETAHEIRKDQNIFDMDMQDNDFYGILRSLYVLYSSVKY